jgi:hypothetical protein
MSSINWSFGDRVTHADRPEWGEGQITSIQPVVIEGRTTQRLTIRFERAGIKKLAAAVANIRPAKNKPQPSNSAAPAASQDPQKIGDLELADRLSKMPDDALDPFISLEDRLVYSLGLYRFSDQGGSLLDWAAMQTGLADPLSRILRHDLEVHYAKFRRNLDRHTGDLVSQLMRQDKAAVRNAGSKAPPQGQQALRQILARR